MREMVVVAEWGRGTDLDDGGFECDEHGYIPMASYCPKCVKHAEMCPNCEYVGPEPGDE